MSVISALAVGPVPVLLTYTTRAFCKKELQASRTPGWFCSPITLYAFVYGGQGVAFPSESYLHSPKILSKLSINELGLTCQELPLIDMTKLDILLKSPLSTARTQLKGFTTSSSIARL